MYNHLNNTINERINRDKVLTPAEKQRNDDLEAAINDGLFGPVRILFNILFDIIWSTK